MTANGHYGVPLGGMSAWADADPSVPAVAHLEQGLEVQLVERRGDWARVLCSNGWSGWVDARLLVEPSAPVGPPSGPPTLSAMAATMTAGAMAGPPPPTMPAPQVSPPLTMPPPTPSPRAGQPPAAGPPGPSGARPWWASRQFRIVAALVVVAAAAGISLGSTGKPATAGEIFTRPADTPGSDTFAPSIATAAPGSNGPAATTAPAPSSSGLVRANGAVPGLYSGTRDAASCDGPKLTQYLEGNPTRGRAWAQAAGIQQSQIRPFVAGLTPAALRVDTRLTDYQFSGGRAVPKQSVLQAGTAVLLDRTAMPRVRCVSGDPLAQPRAVDTTPSYRGPRWPSFSPATLVVVDPASRTAIIVLIDPRTGLPFARVLGSVIVIDLDRPAAGATVIVVEPGGPFTVTGSRFPPGSALTVSWDDPAVTLATPTADGAGNVAVTVNAPAATAIGPHRVTVVGGGVSLVQTVYVIPPLPR
jgi:uncharacterized protein DUF6777